MCMQPCTGMHHAAKYVHMHTIHKLQITSKNA